MIDIEKIVTNLNDPLTTLVIIMFTVVKSFQGDLGSGLILIYLLILTLVGLLLLNWIKKQRYALIRLLIYLGLFTISLEIELFGPRPLLLVIGAVMLYVWSITTIEIRSKVIFTGVTMVYSTIRISVTHNDQTPELVTSFLIQAIVLICVYFQLHKVETTLLPSPPALPTKMSTTSRPQINYITQKDVEPSKQTNENQLLLQEMSSFKQIITPPPIQFIDGNYYRNQHKLPTQHADFPRRVTQESAFRPYKQLVDILPDGVVLIQEQNGDQQIIYSNQRALRSFQASDSQMLSQRMEKKLLLKMETDDKLGGNLSGSSFGSYKAIALRQNSNQAYKAKRSFHALDNIAIQASISFSPYNKQMRDRKVSELQVPAPAIQVQETLKKHLSVVWQRACSRELEGPELRLKFESKVLTEHEQEQADVNVEKDGQKRTRDYEIEILSGMFSGTMTLVLLIRDVTHRNYIKMLKKQNKHKSDTLSFVSHEYRTPLNCIIEMLTTALESKGSSPHFIKCALDNSKYLHNLSNDLLDHAQMKVGKFEITVMEFNLYALAGECLEMFQLMASNKNLILQLQYDRCTRNEVVSDPNRVKQIIVNLIGNAFKFTLKGQITLQVKQVQECNIEISVIDTGIGIRDQDKSKLFKTFGKIENKENDILNKTGVGLGLLISHQLVQLLSFDGTGLQMESEFKKGARFWFNLRNHVITNSVAVSISLRRENSSEDDDRANLQSFGFNSVKRIRTFQKPRFMEDIQPESFKDLTNDILIVDDNQFNVEILKMKLEKLNISHVDFTISGLLAEEMVCKKFQEPNSIRYKIIFMDLEMPVQNGWDTAQHIWKIYDDHKQTVKIIACSGYSQEDEMDNCLNMGFSHYLVKPIKLVELSEVLRVHYD